MIVVLGSRHDPAARFLLESMQDAALCSAEDLTRPGWAWPLGSSGFGRWIVEGEIVDDPEVTGVLVRRSCVYPEELTATHPDDREYLAAEATAFLTFVLERTGACVVNPVNGGAMGEEAIRLENWIPLANQLNLKTAPLRLTPRLKPAAPESARVIEVVGSETFGDAAQQLEGRLAALAKQLGLLFGTFVLDGNDRLVAVSATGRPSAAALPALISQLTLRKRP